MDLSTNQVGALWKRPNKGYNISINNSKYLALPPLTNEEKVEFIVWKRKDDASPSGSFLDNYTKVGTILKSIENILLMKINENIYELIENRNFNSPYSPDLLILASASEYGQDGHNILYYDRYGFDDYGYDREGYDRGGYGRDGYNRLGNDKFGNRRPGMIEYR